MVIAKFILQGFHKVRQFFAVGRAVVVNVRARAGAVAGRDYLGPADNAGGGRTVAAADVYLAAGGYGKRKVFGGKNGSVSVPRSALQIGINTGFFCGATVRVHLFVALHRVRNGFGGDKTFRQAGLFNRNGILRQGHGRQNADN